MPPARTRPRNRGRRRSHSEPLTPLCSTIMSCGPILGMERKYMSVRWSSDLGPGVLGCAFLLLCTVPVHSFAQGSKPLVTQYAECVKDDKGSDIASRALPTPVFESKLGFRTYGVVVAKRSPEGSCNNTSAVYIAGPGGAFQLALQQKPEPLPDGSVFDGNGIEAIRWSPSGERLLVEVWQWTWGTDSTWNTKYVLINPGEQSARELPVSEAINRYFAKPCIRVLTSKGWLDDTRIGIEVSPTKDIDEEGVTLATPSCVQNPTKLWFDVVSGTLDATND